YPHSLSKAANFHRIQYESDFGSSCDLNPQVPVCDLELTWFTDSNYPDASVFAHESAGGQRELVWSSTTMVDYPWSTAEAGSYTFELRMGDTPESSLMAFSETFTVTGASSAGANPETPPAPAAMPDMTPPVSSSSTGATAGQASVSPFGSARYEIPVMVAPGSGGLSPSVALVYDSQAGNGPLGVGWSIAGFSVISRCARTFEQDGIADSERITFTSQDRFCLDGERLMAINGDYGAHGTEYRKERDDFTRVISYGGGSNGPDYFKAWSREGILYEFGSSDDSRIETRAAGLEYVAFAWLHNRTEDTTGNFVLYQYDENQSGPVDFVLSRIFYTGNTTAGTQPFA
ncbi:MAG: SpvB/TcaC N-terminal domain-containing protein, partial [Saprospiraceae bacterium]|nr:SpvB/TcaC N-terminal domain-containing protein [Saprospiraceae bacterium]